MNKISRNGLLRHGKFLVHEIERTAAKLLIVTLAHRILLVVIYFMAWERAVFLNIMHSHDGRGKFRPRVINAFTISIFEFLGQNIFGDCPKYGYDMMRIFQVIYV